ncbi:hypothetical protein Patl1_07113 [Pistacia atlantica]|uniref:Uncharacterized protein n=1 Tax=Pistacia atlantica TaxID=434234 RepID=A0ACC1AI59_9ROSI|nr:hypothetical protein Patl1_07113 [Pistacia atlantica]
MGFFQIPLITMSNTEPLVRHVQDGVNATCSKFIKIPGGYYSAIGSNLTIHTPNPVGAYQNAGEAIVRVEDGECCGKPRWVVLLVMQMMPEKCV